MDIEFERKTTLCLSMHVLKTKSLIVYLNKERIYRSAEMPANLIIANIRNYTKSIKFKFYRSFYLIDLESIELNMSMSLNLIPVSNSINLPPR